MAVANYEATFGSLPPAYVLGPDGRPWHSWRVLILPFLEQTELYNAYNFKEPWDGPNNRALIDRIPSTYISPDRQRRDVHDTKGIHDTSYVVILGSQTAFPGSNALKWGDIKDGLHNTLLAIAVAESKIPWTAPSDYHFDRMSFRVNDPNGRGPGSRIGGARVAFLDGSVYQVADHNDPLLLKALSTANGGEAAAPERLNARIIHGPTSR